MAEPQIKVAAKCKSICPQFVVPDVVASAEHYRDVLEFKIMGYWLDPPVHRDRSPKCTRPGRIRNAQCWAKEGLRY